MDLTLEDFNADFMDSEVRKVDLNSMGGGSIYLRSLGRADVTRFQRISEEILGRVGLNMLAPPELSERVRSKDMSDAGDYLVFKAMCTPNGEPFFDSLKSYMKWTEKVRNVPIDEILCYIKEKMVVFYDPEEDTKEHEKKSE